VNIRLLDDTFSREKVKFINSLREKLLRICNRLLGLGKSLNAFRDKHRGRKKQKENGKINDKLKKPHKTLNRYCYSTFDGNNPALSATSPSPR